MADTPNTRPVLPGEDVKSVSIREFEQRNQEMKELFARELSHERELREEITQKLEEARKLNATEIFRRLEELNHAHKTAMENWARSLPRELFEQWKEDYDKWRLDVGTQLTIIAPHASQINALSIKVGTMDGELSQLKSVGSSHAQALDVRVDALEKSMTPQVLGVPSRIDALEKLVNRVSGAGWLLGLMGLAGVISLVLGLLRLAGAVQ